MEIKIIFENEEQKIQFIEENKENDKIEFLCENPNCKDDEYFNITEMICQSKKWMKQNVTQNMEIIHMDALNAITMNVLNVFKI